MKLLMLVVLAAAARATSNSVRAISSLGVGPIGPLPPEDSYAPASAIIQLMCSYPLMQHPIEQNCRRCQCDPFKCEQRTCVAERHRCPTGQMYRRKCKVCYCPKGFVKTQLCVYMKCGVPLSVDY